MKKTGWAWAAGALYLLAVSLTAPIAAKAKGTKFTDDYVKQTMALAFQQMPDHIKKDGKIIKIERDKPEKVLIPVEDARRIMKAAGISALAQLCNRLDLQLAHRDAILVEERDKKKWSPQQLEYINRLHMFQVMMTLGQDAKNEEEAKRKQDEMAKKLCGDKKIEKQLEAKIRAKWEQLKKKSK